MEIPKKMKAVVTHGPKDSRLELVDVPEVSEGGRLRHLCRRRKSL